MRTVLRNHKLHTRNNPFCVSSLSDQYGVSISFISFNSIIPLNCPTAIHLPQNTPYTHARTPLHSNLIRTRAPAQHEKYPPTTHAWKTRKANTPNHRPSPQTDSLRILRWHAARDALFEPERCCGCRINHMHVPLRGRW